MVASNNAADEQVKAKSNLSKQRLKLVGICIEGVCHGFFLKTCPHCNKWQKKMLAAKQVLVVIVAFDVIFKAAKNYKNCGRHCRDFCVMHAKSIQIKSKAN